METENPYEAPNQEEVEEALYSCSTCGEVCEQGKIHALGNISWFPEMKDFKIIQPERLATRMLNLETRIKSFRCRRCDTITIDLKSI